MAKRAVVVEDMEVAARALSSILNLEGFDEVEVVTDSREALGVIGRLDPDLVVLDLAMPHLSGAQVIQALGKRAGQRPALLMYSAYPRENVDRDLRGTGLGYDGFLEKPATLPQIKIAVRSALDACGVS
jgi:DNA-binding response OmpR family regulator